ncbi:MULTISPECIES: FadR/GntR family transcriptional regulator [unclassified Thalassospira]|uniref:FadR/GntR family transcriptional regulator n=1 Tax=unclassified Thalassospira TaxID=2648997 RepID=UPI00143D5066|nr:FadR/GntR family transcriptional regulator [Thalassospira sp. MCCC 1A01428]
MTDDISQKLSRMVLEGELAAGQQLPTEQSLAESFGVARTVVREAISRLKHDGLVDSRQGVGAFVAEPSARSAFRINPACFEKRQKLLEILQLRTGITSEAAGLAARSRSDADIECMEQAYRDMESSLAEGHDGAEQLVLAERTFYRHIAEASGNQYILEFLSMLDARIDMELRSVAVKNARVTEWSAEVLVEHQAVLDAIRDQNEDAASQAVRHHYTYAAQRLADRADLADT